MFAIMQVGTSVDVSGSCSGGPPDYNLCRKADSPEIILPDVGHGFCSLVNVVGWAGKGFCNSPIPLPG